MIYNKLIELLPKCGLNETHYGQNGVTVAIEPKSNERVIFFVIDGKCSTFRDDFKLSGNICDLLIYYKVVGKNECILCLIELKGENTKKAFEQIKNTRDSIKSMINPRSCNTVILKGYICIHKKSAPIQSKFKTEGIFNDFQLSKDGDIGTFLRKNSYN